MTDWLKVANRAKSTLAQACLLADDHIHVAAGEGTLFPAAGYFMITIQDEIMKGTQSGIADQIDVTRAQEGTVAAAHGIGQAVRLHVTAAIIEQLQDAVDGDGELHLTPKASSTGAEGTVFYDSDDDHLWVATE